MDRGPRRRSAGARPRGRAHDGARVGSRPGPPPRGREPAGEDVRTAGLAWEAVSAALAEAGIELRDIEGAVTASQDFWEGRTISSMSVNETVGGTPRSAAKAAAEGA